MDLLYLGSFAYILLTQFHQPTVLFVPSLWQSRDDRDKNGGLGSPGDESNIGSETKCVC